MLTGHHDALVLPAVVLDEADEQRKSGIHLDRFRDPIIVMRPYRPQLMFRLQLTLFLMAATIDAAPRQFHVWATSCAHVPADIRRGRESMAKPILQSEGLIKDAPAFLWDIMVDVGDLSAHQYPPGDKDGRELIRQYQKMTKHRREQIYNLPGNHDAPYYDHGPGSWIRKWGDPMGKNTKFSGVDPKRRPFPVEGTWERYKFQAGNVIFLMLSDRNDVPEPVGRGHSRDRRRGGYPAGAVTRATFNWWKQQVLANQDKIIVTMHHHVLRDTTIASGKGEGNPRYHGASGGAAGSSYLYYLIENEDPDNFKYLEDAHVFEDFLDEFHRKHGRGAIDLWIGGHTHVRGPKDDWGGKTISERRWGVGFLQVAALTKSHGGSFPLSRILTFADNSDAMTARVYLHEDWYEDNPIGFYEPADIEWPLRHAFRASAPIKTLPPFPAITEVVRTPYLDRKDSRNASAVFTAAKTPDRIGDWDSLRDGKFNLTAQLNKLHHLPHNSPTVVNDSPIPAGKSLKFEGRQRVRIGSIDMSGWKNLTVSVWIKNPAKIGNMRIISKDDLGTPGNFVLLQNKPGTWTFRVWDKKVGKWREASWADGNLSDGQWHRLTGIVDSTAGEVRLTVDGKLRAHVPWTGSQLDDSDQTDLVVGADSGKDKFGHTFTGLIHGVTVTPGI